MAICPSTQGVVYHVFPREKKLQKAWIEACKRKEKILVDTGCVCSNHFTEEDYLIDLKQELLNLNFRKLLKKDAIPMQNLSPGIVVTRLVWY